MMTTRKSMLSNCVRAAALAGFVLSCAEEEAAPRAQWLLEVRTDAPVPLVGDRLLIELLDAEGALACPSCRRDATAARDKTDWPVSFGVESTTRALYLRSRLYRADHIDPNTGQPDPLTSIDNLAKLPPTGDQILNVYVGLVLDCFGREVRVPSAKNGEPGQTCTSKSLAETPPEAALTPPELKVGGNALLDVSKKSCVAPSDSKMACIPGGVYFLGSSLAPAPHSSVEATPTPERLVGIESFLLDRREVTVGEFYAFAGGNAVCNNGVFCQDLTMTLQQYCTFPTGATLSSQEQELPMNCLSWQVAKNYCTAQNKRLPTEAEWEYVARNGSLGTRFSWGDDSPTCARAVLARDTNAKQGSMSEANECLSDLIILGGPEAHPDSALSSLGDRTFSFFGGESGVVYDLAGNVAEWMEDPFTRYDDPSSCLKSTDAVIVLVSDCAPTTTAIVEDRSVRGGSWLDTLQSAWSANRGRHRAELIIAAPEIGFRCACDLDPATGGCLAAPTTP